MTDIAHTQPPVVVTTVQPAAAEPGAVSGTVSGPAAVSGPVAGSVSSPTASAATPGASETTSSTGGATTIVYVNPPAALVPAAEAGASAVGYADGLPRPSRKGASLLTAYALFFFFGWTGMHQVYLGNTLRGVSYIFTFSWFTLALWIDLFTLPSQVRRVNAERMLGLR